MIVRTRRKVYILSSRGVVMALEESRSVPFALEGPCLWRRHRGALEKYLTAGGVSSGQVVGRFRKFHRSLIVAQAATKAGPRSGPDWPRPGPPNVFTLLAGHLRTRASRRRGERREGNNTSSRAVARRKNREALTLVTYGNSRRTEINQIDNVRLITGRQITRLTYDVRVSGEKWIFLEKRA
jgi:hypothetical protein